MKISIVTPSLNQGEYIEDNIVSVINQNYRDFEHIIIDGKSTDKTIGILEKYKHLRWISEPDNGMCEALNKGFRMATGEWVVWLNADDFLLKGVFHDVVNFIKEHPDVDVVYGNALIVNRERSIIKPFWGKKFDLNEQIHIGITPSVGTFIRKAIFEEGNLMDGRFEVCMDVEFFTRLGTKGKKFAYISQFFGCFRVHGDNLSFDRNYYYKSNFSVWKQGLMVVKNMLRFLFRLDVESRMGERKWIKRREQRRKYLDIYCVKPENGLALLYSKACEKILFIFYNSRYIFYKIKKGHYRKSAIRRIYGMQNEIFESVKVVQE